MRKTVHGLLIAAATVPAIIVAGPAAQAGDGGFAAGLFGGLAAGTIIGATAGRPYYYAPPPPPPAYYDPGPRYAPACYWTRGRPYWDDYRGAWIYSRVRVCD